MASYSIPYKGYQILAKCALYCKQMSDGGSVGEPSLSYVKCIVHNLHFLIYYYITFN